MSGNYGHHGVLLSPVATVHMAGAQLQDVQSLASESFSVHGLRI